MTDPRDIAIEHVIWAATIDGQRPEDVLAALGVRWTGRNPPDWVAVELALASRWRMIQEARPAAAEPTQLRLVFGQQGRAA